MEFRTLKLQPEEYEKILFILSSLQHRAKAQAVCLISRSGQEIAFHGEADWLDRQALSSLAASNLAATFGLAKLIREREFERIYHKGEKFSILINPAGETALLLFILENDGGPPIDWRSLKQAIMILEDMMEKSNQRS
ncbi:MAG TPA: roadblock/LC7 domain-containing protein [Acidobacteriota bacterium]|nr:roadblock/LC7 domain-containing protein [Acidobacteriota bacterium]